MSVSHLMHYNPFKTINIFQFASVHHFYKKMWVVTQGKISGNLNGSKQYQRIVGCGLMDHNNYLIGSVGFMS
jgi:hypothetical protein